METHPDTSLRYEKHLCTIEKFLFVPLLYTLRQNIHQDYNKALKVELSAHLCGSIHSFFIERI